MQTRELMEILNDIAPFSMAESYDNVGLLVGDGEVTVKAILLALDLSEKVIDEAMSVGANVIITHHPFIFHPLKRVDTSSKSGKMIGKLLGNNICVIAMHTNMDKAKDGLNDHLASVVGVENVKVLVDEAKGCCLSVYVPGDHLEDVKEAMFRAGAGKIGEYIECAFDTPGKGQFFPMKDAQPYLGAIGDVVVTDEIKVEVYCDTHHLNAVVYAMLEAHPYERPVYYAFETKGHGEYGFGRYGELKEQTSLAEYCAFLQNKLSIPIRYVGKGNKPVRTVGVCSGAGSDEYALAEKLGLDAFITGDIKHNVAVDAVDARTALIDGGHYGTEIIFKNILSRHLQKRLDELQCNIDILNSQMEKSPWSYV